MNIDIKYNGNVANRVVLECSLREFLIINDALLEISKKRYCHPEEKKLAGEMFFEIMEARLEMIKKYEEMD